MIKVKPPVDVEEYQVGNLRVMRGGKGPPLNGGGINWLNALDAGTGFSCKKKGDTDILHVYVVAFKYERTIILVDGFHSEHRFAVDPEEFCKKFSHWETIGKEERQAPKEIEDDSDRTVLDGRVADDVDAEGRQPRSEEEPD